MSALTIICIILSVIFIIYNLIKGDFGMLLLWIFTLALNIYVGTRQISEKRAKEKFGEGITETRVIQDVKGYSVDTTTVINGADTTKTYVLTYWK